MSILINGMEMPKSCLECPCTDGDDDYDCVCNFSKDPCLMYGRQPTCPLIELPPHGRLIDAEVLKRNIAANLPAAFQDFSTGLCFIVDMQRTVIEADRNGER